MGNCLKTTNTPDDNYPHLKRSKNGYTKPLKDRSAPKGILKKKGTRTNLRETHVGLKTAEYQKKSYLLSQDQLKGLFDSNYSLEDPYAKKEGQEDDPTDL